MALLETKVLQVRNDQEAITNMSNIMGSFGWTVLSVQVTHSQNTKTYSSAWDQLGGNRSQTVETTTINYATMTLQRDKHMPNYAEIVRLENEYEQCEARVQQADQAVAAAKGAEEKKARRWMIILVILGIFGSLFAWIIQALLESVIGRAGMNVLEWVLVVVLGAILVYSVLRIILDGVSYVFKRFLNKPLAGLDKFLAKAPRSVWSYLYGKPAANKKPAKKLVSEQLQEEADASNEPNLRRMAELRQQAESLLA